MEIWQTCIYSVIVGLMPIAGAFAVIMFDAKKKQAELDEWQWQSDDRYAQSVRLLLLHNEKWDIEPAAEAEAEAA